MQRKEYLSKRYERIYGQLQMLFSKTKNKFSRMATAASLLHHKMPYYFWTGFYFLYKGDLIVGPYQGTVACLLLEKKKGVCWAGVLSQKTVVVPDIHKFSGHIACNRSSNSEIVVPLFNQVGKVWAVLDVDSYKFNAFSEVDREWLEKIVKMI